jgi:hypothetical protein
MTPELLKKAKIPAACCRPEFFCRDLFLPLCAEGLTGSHCPQGPAGAGASPWGGVGHQKIRGILHFGVVLTFKWIIIVHATLPVPGGVVCFSAGPPAGRIPRNRRVMDQALFAKPIGVG